MCECVSDNLISPLIDFCVSRVPGDGRIGPLSPGGDEMFNDPNIS